MKGQQRPCIPAESSQIKVGCGTIDLSLGRGEGGTKSEGIAKPTGKILSFALRNLLAVIKNFREVKIIRKSLYIKGGGVTKASEGKLRIEAIGGGRGGGRRRL